MKNISLFASLNTVFREPIKEICAFPLLKIIEITHMQLTKIKIIITPLLLKKFTSERRKPTKIIEINPQEIYTKNSSTALSNIFPPFSSLLMNVLNIIFENV